MKNEEWELAFLILVKSEEGKVKNEKLRRHCANGFYRWFTKQLNR